MIKPSHFSVLSMCISLISLCIPNALAESNYHYGIAADTIKNVQSQVACSYGQKVNEKGLRTVGNLLLGVAEVPKGIINTTNDSNIFFGLTGGLLKGVINTTGRVLNGVVDLVTMPVPTKTFVYPEFSWENFDEDTRYGDLLRLDRCPENDAVIAKPVAMPKKQPVVITPPRQNLTPSGAYKDRSNQKLDTLFQRQMMK